MLPHPFREVTVKRDRGGRPGFRMTSRGARGLHSKNVRLQLRDSAGIAPASPMRPRNQGHLSRVFHRGDESIRPEIEGNRILDTACGKASVQVPILWHS
jgi:hypothetical protein